MVEGQARITEFDDIYKDYCIMKGLLHRLDHCSSAWIPVEDETKDEISKFVEVFMKKQNFEPNDLQQFAKANQDKNVIVISKVNKDFILVTEALENKKTHTILLDFIYIKQE